MPKVRVDDRKPFDITLRQFKRVCERAGIVREVRERKHYIKPTTRRKLAKHAAISRAKKDQKMALRPKA